MRRRDFLVRALGLSGVALAPALFRRAAGAQERRLRVLHGKHVAPEYDAYLQAFATSFGQAHGCRVEIDVVPLADLTAAVAAEVERGEGHDVLTLNGTSAWTYADALADVSDVTTSLGRAAGGWVREVVSIAIVRGRSVCVPSGFLIFPWIVNRAHLAQVGEEYTDRTSWEDLRRIGAKLRKAGRAIGLPYARTPLATDVLVSMMQAFHASMFDRNGDVAFAKKEMVEVLRFGAALYREAMTDAVLTWDDASAVRFLGSPEGSMTCSPISWRAAAREGGGAARDLAVVKPPRGLDGVRVGALRPISHAIARYSTVGDLARRFLTSLAEDGGRGLAAARGTQFPALKRFLDAPLREALGEDAAFLRRYGDYGRLVTAPGPLGKAGGKLYDAFVVPRMFADVATGRKTPRLAIDEAERTLRA